jgi:transcription elongation factor Elf1
MPRPKIKLQDHKTCPKCNGTTGVKQTQLANARFHIHWTERPEDRRLMSYNKVGKVKKSVVCMDCQQRFDLEVV